MEVWVNACVGLVGNPKGKSHLKELDVDGRIISNFMLENSTKMERPKMG